VAPSYFLRTGAELAPTAAIKGGRSEPLGKTVGPGPFKSATGPADLGRTESGTLIRSPKKMSAGGALARHYGVVFQARRRRQ